MKLDLTAANDQEAKGLIENANRTLHLFLNRLYSGDIYVRLPREASRNSILWKLELASYVRIDSERLRYLTPYKQLIMSFR